MISDAQILAALGFSDAPLLGAGSEAQVYGLDGDRIVRIMRPGARLEEARTRAALMGEIASGGRHLPFRTPKVESVREMEGRVLAIEARLPGEPVSQLLELTSGADRTALLADYLDTAGKISTIEIGRDFFGPLIGGAALHASSWNGFLAQRLRHSLLDCPTDLRPAVQEASQAIWPEPDHPALVHMDFFPGNVLAEKTTITAVLDFGPSAVIGDKRMDAWSAVAYLDFELSPAAIEADRAQGRAWLGSHGLLDDYPRGRQWLAAYWSFAVDDAALMAWCRRVLLTEAR